MRVRAIHHASVMIALEVARFRLSSAFTSCAFTRYGKKSRHLSSNLNVDMKETRYQISACPHTNWITLSFPDSQNTTVGYNAKESFQQQQVSTPISSIPESVLQYERQLRKIQALDRASKTNVTVRDHLHVLHVDEHLVVTNKPSGILCVPGVNNYRSLLDLVHETYSAGNVEQSNLEEDDTLPKDSMIAHRLDMDTSGVVVFARTRLGMSKLHEAFRERTNTKKMYEALLVGWLDIKSWIDSADNILEDIGRIDLTTDLGGGEINLPLQRDHKHPPFMRVSTPQSETEAQQAVKDLNHAGWKKIVAKKPKPSTTHLRILTHETWNGHPVTRVALNPITGRTHQLRVHCAALGHPILGDPAYGYCGEAHPNGGFSDETIVQMSPTCVGMDLRRDIDNAVRESGRTMCLHARMLGFDHPSTGKAVSFEVEPSF